MPRPSLAAALIVKDERDHLPDCLASLRALVDEVVVYDTGSADGSQELARRAGVRVVQGFWDGDFARARNAAMAEVHAPWVLSVDADERVRAEPDGLRRMLRDAGGTDLFGVRIIHDSPPELGGHYTTVGPRLLRRDRLQWVGQVHERPARPDGAALQVAACPREVLSLTHLGYLDPEVLHRKSRRNAELGQQEVDRLLAGEPRDEARLAQVLLDLGRSRVGCRQQQGAVDAFEAVRALAPGSARAVQATDGLAGVLLAAGHDDLVLVLAEQLRAAGVPAGYCDWLCAQALAQLGRPAEALRLLRGVDALVDATGRELDLGPVWEARALLASLVGGPGEAIECLVAAMAGHGRIRGRGELLARLWEDRPVGELPDLVRRWGGRRAEALVVELAGAPAPGPELALALTAEGLTSAAELPIAPACAS
jgi:hypothetical protein